MIRFVLIAASVSSLFLFPYPLTLILSFVASLFFPPTAFLIGAFADLLYFTSYDSALPTALLFGIGLSLIALFVRRFVRTRIIEL